MTDVQKQNLHELAETLRSEQNFTAAVIAGAVATILSAAAYGITVETWPFSYGFAAAGIGIVIGVSMQFLGRGLSTRFAVMAALYTIAGCVIGNLFLTIMNLAQATASSPIDVLRNNTLTVLVKRSATGVDLIHYVFWFVSVWFACFLVKRPLSRSERLAIGTSALQRY